MAVATVRNREYPHYDELLDTVYRTRDWWRTIYILERVFVYVGILFAAVCVLTLIEASFHLKALVRWPICFGLLGYVLGGMALLVFRPLFREWTEEEVAVHIERAFPQIDNGLINALQLGADRDAELTNEIVAIEEELDAFVKRFFKPVGGGVATQGVWVGEIPYDSANLDKHGRLHARKEELEALRRRVRAASSSQSPGMVAGLIRQVAGEIQAYPVRQAVNTRRARVLAVCGFLAFAALCVWAGLAFDRFSNALQRLIFPGSNIMALGKVAIESVSPGDTRIESGSDLVVDVQTRGGPSSEVEAVLTYTYDGSEKPVAKTLSPVAANLYRGRVDGVKTPLRYAVNIGGTESRPYQVEVIVQPVIIRRCIAYRFPAYTIGPDWQNREDPDCNGDVRAPMGTVVTLKFTTNKPIKEGYVQIGGNERLALRVLENPTQLEASFVVERDGVYTVQLTDTDGLSNTDPRENKIIALVDRPPRIEFSVPGKDITAAPAASVKLVLSAGDDFGLSSVALIARRGKEGQQRVLKSWTEFAEPRKMSMPFTWDLGTKEYGYQVGDEVFYYAVARDNHADVTATREIAKPQETKSAEFKIKIEDKEQVAKARKERINSWEAELRKVLEDQIAARHRVASLDKLEATGTLQKEGVELFKIQSDIFTRTVTIAKGIEPTDDPASAVKESLTVLAYGEMTRCAKLAQSTAQLRDLKSLRQGYGSMAGSQDRIIDALRRLLNILPEMAEKGNRGKADEEDVSDVPDDTQETMKDLLRNLKEMVREQKKVIETTDELAKLPMEDYTPEAEKKLDNVKAIEEKWSQFLKATISDLSKMQDQDFANTTMLQELIQIHTEIEMAKDALSAKATEIATALEDNGLGLAEKLTKQLEKWLPDTPDRDRWQMEEPLTDGYETPMAELPKELEDIVGDLMEEEEDLQQDIEDATSSWADSMDAAGWDAMDGPISNFAANGVTGNRLPNSNEMSGRSGEGRQGQSSGEMVSDEFTGKGGRRTPTRLTGEAFSKGQIKDSSSTPPGGATGGGKAAGSSGEGLEGPPPPDIQMKMKDFALRQAALRNTAEKIALKFEVLNYPPIFEPVIKDMKVLEDRLNSGRYQEAARQHNVLLKNLGNTRMFLEGQVSLDQVRSPSLPAHLQEEIIDSASTAVPDEFKEYIKSYYEAISRAK